MDPLFELNITVSDDRTRTLVEIFSQAIKVAIQDKRLVSGYKMPSSREFARIKKVSRNTIIAVYDELCVTGYLETITGKGTFVKTQKQSPIVINNSQQKSRLTPYWNNPNHNNFLPKQTTRTFDFSVGKPNTAQFPFDVWRKVINKASRLQYLHNNKPMPQQGLVDLRQGIVNHLSYSRAISSSFEQVCITSGAQQALDLICKLLITPQQTKVAMERPGYPMAKHLFNLHGAKIIYIDVDEHGMCIEQIPNDVALIYTTPSHQFPTGVAMSLARRRQLLHLANKQNMSIIEDDYDGEFRLSATPIDALKSLDMAQNVFYVGTFSKCMFPDIRLGFCVLPPWAVKAFYHAKFLTDWHVSSLMQTALSLFIREGHLIKHIRKMRKCYQERYQTICRQLQLHCSEYLTPANVFSGVHLSVKVVEHINAFTLANLLKEQGITISSIAHFENNSNSNSNTHNSLILGYGNITKEEIKSAVLLIEETLKST